MVSKFLNKLKKFKQDNQGAAIIVAIVTIAFIGMLIAMLAYMAYYNYLMKQVDRSAKDNFYTAEYALDVLNTGLQHDISKCMSEAYVEANKITGNTDANAINLLFQTSFKEKLKNEIGTGGVTSDRYNLNHLKNIWASAGVTVAGQEGQEGAYLVAKSGKNMLVDGGSGTHQYLTMKNMRIVYTDQRGYVSIIETDIRLIVPSIDFAKASSMLDVENYSLIANNSLVNKTFQADDTDRPTMTGVTFGSDGNGAGVQITGNVYGGKKGIVVANSTGISFKEDTKDAGNGYSYHVVAKSIDLDNASRVGTNNKYGMEIDDCYETYVTDINVASSHFISGGSMYVGDDLDIAGKKSNVTLKGTYIGYGNQGSVADGSSSILINGANTTLDIRGLKSLALGGHAYVGAKKYDADIDRLYAASHLDPDRIDDNTYNIDNFIPSNRNERVSSSDKIEDTEAYDKIINSSRYNLWDGLDEYADLSTGNQHDNVPRNTSDVMTGESITVKANQLFYMVPTECIGYEKHTDTQKFARNPMTYKEYQILCNTIDYDSNAFLAYKNSTEYRNFVTQYKAQHNGAEPADTAIPLEELPDTVHKYDVTRMSLLWNKLGGVAYAKEEPKAVYRRVNGEVLVYLYLDFNGDETAANNFYKAYYTYDEDAVNSYVNSYIDNFLWSNQSGFDLMLAGNAFRIVNGKVEMVDNVLGDTVKVDNMKTNQEDYSQEYASLMHVLKKNAMMSSTESVSDLFENIMDTSLLVNYKAPSSTNTSMIFTDNEVGVSAYVGTDDVKTADLAENTGVIITSGNVYVNKNYEGLIIAKGNIYVCGGCNSIIYNPSKAIKALRLSGTNFNGDEIHVYDLFGAEPFETGNDAGESINTRDLVTYENWKKE